MSKQYEDDDDFDTEDDTSTPAGNDPAGLQKELRRFKRELKTANEELASFRSEGRASSIKEILAATGIPEAAGKFIPADIVTKEAITEWAKQNADVFGAKPPVDGDGQKAGETSGVDSAEVEGLQGLAALNSGSTSPATSQALVARMKAASNPAEVAAVMRDAAAAGMRLN